MAENEFQIAGDAAVNQFNAEIAPKLTPEEREGIRKLQAWWKANYMKAGHKQLARGLLYKLNI